MAKELPYFRFTPQEWQNGNISLESYHTKGVFADICSYYWVRDCSLTLAMLQKKFSNVVDDVNSLVNLHIIEWDEETDYIQINFLNDQYDMLSEKRKRRQDAGSKGGKQKSSNAKAMLKQKPSYKDKDKDKDKDNIFFDDFWDLYDKKVGDKTKLKKKWAKLTDESRKLIIDYIPKYIKSQPDKKFRLNPETFFNNKSWLDEIIGEDSQIQKPPSDKPWIVWQWTNESKKQGWYWDTKLGKKWEPENED